MSEGLRDLSIKHINRALKLIEEGKYEEAFKELEQAEKASLKAEANDIFLDVQIEKGYLMHILGAYEEAKQTYEKALDMGRKILNKYPENETCQLDVGRTLISLGNLFCEVKYLKEAKKMYEEAFEIYEKLLLKHPKKLEYYSVVIETLKNLKALRYSMGSIEELKETYVKELEIMDRLLNTDPKNVAYLLNIGNNLNLLGFLLKDMGRFEEAKQRYEKSLEIRERLLQEDSENSMYQADVGETLYNLGYLFYSVNQFEDSKQRFEEALKMYEKALKKDPENVEYQSSIEGILNNLGVLLIATGHLDEANEKLEKVLEIREKLLQTDPENVTYLLNTGNTLNNLGVLLIDMDRHEDAKQRYEKALEIYEKLLQKEPENLTYQSKVAMTGNNLVSLLKNHGILMGSMDHHDESKQSFQKALEILEKLLTIEPENVKYQLEVGITLNILGDLLSAMSQIEDAKQRYEKALGIYEKLLQKEPENSTYQSEAETTRCKLENLLEEMRSNNYFENRVSLLFDADEYMVSMLELEQSIDSNTLHLTSSKVEQLFNNPILDRIIFSYYFQLKNSIIVTTGSFVPPSDKAYTKLRSKLQSGSISNAHYFATKYLATNSLTLPVWIEMIDTLLSSHKDPVVSKIWKDCTKKYNQYPSLQPLTTYENGTHTIHISILMRTFLKALLCNYSNITETSVMPSDEEFYSFKCLQLVMYLAYSWFTKDEFPPSNLPEPIFVNAAAFHRASSIAYLQLQFILLHEIAHIHLGHNTKTCFTNIKEPSGSVRINLKNLGIAILTKEQKLIKEIDIRLTEEDDIEVEADKFAFEKLLEIPDANNDECLFAVLSLLNFLHMSEATTNIKDSELENGYDSEYELALRLKKFIGQAAKRRAVIEKRLRDSWNDEGKYQAYQSFSSFTDEYIKWLSKVSMDDILEIVDVWTYNDDRLLRLKILKDHKR